MPFQTNCPSCGKNMLMRESMFGKPKRCSHCDKLFRVGGGPVPTEAEFSAFEAEAAAAPSKTATATKAKPRQIVVTKEAVADVIPVADDRRDRTDRRPPPRRKKGGAPLWLILLCIGMLIAGVGVAGFFIWKAVDERGGTQAKTDDPKTPNKPDDRNLGGPVVSRANLGKLVKGMPQDTALAMLGGPTSIDESMEKIARESAPPGVVLNKSNYLRTYLWRDGINQIEVGFINNRVETFKGRIGGYEVVNGIVVRDDAVVAKPPDPIGLPPKMPRLTVEKFRQLALGMPEAAAEQILGKWNQRQSGLRSNPANPRLRIPVSSLTWREGVNSIHLNFVNGQLVEGNANFGGTSIPLGG